MRGSREDKQRSHERIVDVAAARIRESGTTTPGVAEIMQAAGLTHGGFYKHFDSRADLIAEAVDRAFADNRQAMATLTEEAADPLAAFVDWYVSADHRDNPASGCSVVALGADMARSEPGVREAYTEQVRRYLDQLVGLIAGADPDPDPDPDTRRQATAMLCTLVGAVLVARAVDDPALSEEIIRDVRATLTAART